MGSCRMVLVGLKRRSGTIGLGFAHLQMFSHYRVLKISISYYRESTNFNFLYHESTNFNFVYLGSIYFNFVTVSRSITVK